MKINKTPLRWMLLAGASALLLAAGLSLLLSHFQALAQPAMEIAALQVEKNVNTDMAAPGETLIYTITIQNTGDPAGDVWLTDTLPVELNCITESLTANFGSWGVKDDVITWTAEMQGYGQTAYIHFSAEISSDITCATVVNTARVTGTGTLVENSATTRVLGDIGDLTGVKSVVPQDLAEPGDILTYTITIQNTGDPVGDVWLTDTLPAELNYITESLTANFGSWGVEDDVITWTAKMQGYGQTAYINLSAQISSDYTGWITNTAEIVAPCQAFTISVGINVYQGQPYLEASKSVSPDWARPGENLTYTVRITNTGDAVVETAWMTDVLPSEVDYVTGDATTGSLGEAGGIVTWSGSLAPAEAATIAFVTQIEPTLSENTRFTNTAEFTGAGSLVLAAAPARAITHFERYFPIMFYKYPPHFYFPIFFHNYPHPPIPLLNAIPTPVDHSYTVTWQDVVEIPVDHYVLQQARDSGFSSPEQVWTTTLTSQAVEDVYCAYYYRVRADKAGDWGEGPWSNVEQGESAPPDAPVLNDVPAPGANLAYDVSWSASSVPIDWYVLEESTDANFSVITRRWWPTTASQQVQNCLLYDHTFYYRVRADDNDCWGQGPWSNVKSVAVFRPTPVLNDIPDPGGDGSYTVSWSPVSIPIDRYVLQESTDANFTSVTQEWQTTATSQLVQPGSSYGTLYYRVRADDDDCWGQGPWSEPKSVDVPYFDDFSDSGSGWPRVEKEVIPETDSYYRLRYEHNQYRIMIDAGGPNIWFHQPDALAPYTPPSDKYCVEVSMKLEKNQPPYTGWDYYPYWANGGLIFGVNEANTNLYAVCVTVGGGDTMGWLIVNNPTYEYPYKGCNYIQGVVGGEDAGALAIGNWHRIQISVNGDWASVYIDGVHKGDWKMGGLKNTTRVGLIGGDYEITPVDFRFDNFKVIPNVGCTP